MDKAPPEREAAATEARAWAIRMHDLRTPLTVVLGRAQLARRRLRRGDDPARVDTELEALEAAVARLVAAVERLDRRDPPA
jgi:signal transduction histidine kinase